MTTAIKRDGFTLIELMVVVVIISVLTALALPSYNRYLRSSARAEAQSQMLLIAGELERWRAKNLSYVGFTPNAGFAPSAGSLVTVTNATMYLPVGSTATNYRYQIALLDDSTRTTSLTSTDIRAGQGWIMIAQPNTSNTTLSSASRLVLNSQGLRCMSDLAISDASMKSNIASTSVSDAGLCASSQPW